MVTIVLAPKPAKWIEERAKLLLKHGGVTHDLELIREVARLARGSGEEVYFARKNRAPHPDTMFTAEEVLLAVMNGCEIRPLEE